MWCTITLRSSLEHEVGVVCCTIQQGDKAVVSYLVVTNKQVQGRSAMGGMYGIRGTVDGK